MKTAPSGALRGTLRAGLAGVTRLAPTSSARVADLASAMKVAGTAKVAAGMAKVDVVLDKPAVTKALTAARNANYVRLDLQQFVADAPGKTAAAVQSGARSVSTGMRRAAGKAVDAFRPVGYQMEVAGIGSTRAAGQSERLLDVMAREGRAASGGASGGSKAVAVAKTTDEARGLIDKAGWPTRLQDASEAPRKGALVRPAYEGERDGSGMLGKPPAVTEGVHERLKVDIKGEYADLMPKARQTFGEANLVKLAEELGIKDAGKLANARIEVRGRGVFYTEHGEVTFVEATRRNINVRGLGISRELGEQGQVQLSPGREVPVRGDDVDGAAQVGQGRGRRGGGQSGGGPGVADDEPGARAGAERGQPPQEPPGGRHRGDPGGNHDDDSMRLPQPRALVVRSGLGLAARAQVGDRVGPLPREPLQREPRRCAGPGGGRRP